MHLRSLVALALAALSLPVSAVTAQEDERWADPVSAAGQEARGLYLGGRFVQLHGPEGVVEAVQRSRMNAVVLDLKDAEGRVHHSTGVEALQSARTGWLGDSALLIRTLHDNDIYTIARIVCFADRSLPEQAPHRAIQDIRPRRGPWVSWGTGGTWLDPYNTENHQMVVELSREAAALGFDEIQLDYVRFPVDDGTRWANYPELTEESRSDVLMRLLRAVDEAVAIPLGVDVFGLAAYRRGDPSGLGQDLEAWVRHVEVYTPMLYINSMRNWRRGAANRTFQLVFDGIHRLRERLGQRPIIRPFLQAFERGSGGHFGPGFIADQVRGARRGRADGFLFWHPGHTYGVVSRAMRSGRTRRPFPIPEAIRRERAQGSVPIVAEEPTTPVASPRRRRTRLMPGTPGPDAPAVRQLPVARRTVRRRVRRD